MIETDVTCTEVARPIQNSPSLRVKTPAMLSRLGDRGSASGALTTSLLGLKTFTTAM